MYSSQAQHGGSYLQVLELPSHGSQGIPVLYPGYPQEHSISNSQVRFDDAVEGPHAQGQYQTGLVTNSRSTTIRVERKKGLKRTKTGCLTCRRRSVKCDEKRPSW